MSSRIVRGGLVVTGLVLATQASAGVYTFTDSADWALGVETSVNHTTPPPGTVQLDPGTSTPFNHIWVAASGRGTVIRVNTDHNELDGYASVTDGAVLGEYYTAPNGRARNPSRTTVDFDGNVWVGNRDESSGGMGSVAKIRWDTPTTDPNTSTGVWNAGTGAFGTFDARAWTNLGGADNGGGTSTAQDSAIEYYVRTPGTNNRTIAVDANNDVWVGGYGNKLHAKIDGSTGTVVPGTTIPINPGGYGGLIDGNGVLWSSGWSSWTIGRYDPATNVLSHVSTGGSSYGLGIDTNGNIFNTHLNNNLSKLDSDGNLLWTKTVGAHSGGRGVAVTPVDNHVWMANSSGSIVTRTDNDGNIIAQINVGNNPTGISVDSNGKVWATNLGSSTLSRIDPLTNLVDLTVDLGRGANPYNYSDMTGTGIYSSTVPTGTWRYVIDSSVMGQLWDKILWNTEVEGSTPLGTDILVEARASDTLLGLSSQAYTSYASSDLLGLSGQYLELRATLKRTGGVGSPSPVLSDISVFTVTNGVPVPASILLMISGLLALRRRHA